MTQAYVDTICALATPPGRGGVAVVRISGPEVPHLAQAVLGVLPAPRRVHLTHFRDAAGDTLDSGLALFFPAPNSFTGEHVLELQGHGGPVVVDRILRRLTELGARLARPGEFSERAFLNGKLDLAQAEAVADLIAASTEAGARAALRSLDGAFSTAIDELTEAVTQLRMYVESAIDFPEEEIDFLSDGAVERRLRDIRERLHTVGANAHRGRLLRDGMTVVIAGRPNAGKSSLLNRLAGYDAAIVTEIEGTTRDTVREHIQLDGMPLHVIDTAGLRDSADPVEQEGIRRAWDAIASADRVLLVVDDARGLGAAERGVAERLPKGVGLTVIRNKIDLTGATPGARDDELGAAVYLSAATGTGLDALRDHLKECMGYDEAEGSYIARRRHLDALARAGHYLDAAQAQLASGAGELVAEDLRGMQDALGEITGKVTSDELLGRIFSTFCIGK